MHFPTFSPGANLGILGAAAVLVWRAGTRLATHADVMLSRTKLSNAFPRLTLPGLVTPLPEIVTVTTAVLRVDARLVAGNPFGGVAMQIAVLAVGGAVAVLGALTSFTPPPICSWKP